MGGALARQCPYLYKAIWFYIYYSGVADGAALVLKGIMPGKRKVTGHVIK